MKQISKYHMVGRVVYMFMDAVENVLVFQYNRNIII